MPMDTNLGRVVIYDEGLPPIMMRGLFITWSFNQVTKLDRIATYHG